VATFTSYASHGCFGASPVRLDTYFRAEGIPCLYVRDATQLREWIEVLAEEYWGD
jgi:hypothetical protein